MSRLRRIADRDRIFFLITNLVKGAAPLSPVERDLLLTVLEGLRAARDFLILGYVVMPDHAHLLVACRTEAISRLMHDWKFKTGYAIRQHRGNRGPLWQSRYFDFICRRTRDVSNKLQYIHENPVTAGLVSSGPDWRWSSAGFYAKTSATRIVPDEMDFSGDPDELLWPAPWRRL